MALPLDTLRELVKLAGLRPRILERSFDLLKKHVKDGNFLSTDQRETLDLVWELRELRVFSNDEFNDQIDAQILDIVGDIGAAVPPERSDGFSVISNESDERATEAAAGGKPVNPERERQAKEKPGDAPAPTPDAAPVPPVEPVAEPTPPVTVPVVEPTTPVSEPIAPTTDSSDSSDGGHGPSAGDNPGIESYDVRARCVTECGTGCSEVGASSDFCTAETVEDGEACSGTNEARCYAGDAPAPGPAPAPDVGPAAPLAPVDEPIAPMTAPVAETIPPVVGSTAGVTEPTSPLCGPAISGDSKDNGGRVGGSGGNDMCGSAGGIHGIESSHGEACCLGSRGECGGDGCTSAAKDADCCVSDVVEEECCSTKGSIPCNIDDGHVPAPRPDEAPVAPAEMAEPSSPVPEPATIGGDNHDDSSDEDEDGGDGGDDVFSSVGSSIPDLESSDGEACCLASCGQCDGDEYISSVHHTDGSVSDFVDDDQVFSVKGSIPCDIDDATDGGNTPSSVSEDAPAAPGATPAEPAASVSEPSLADIGRDGSSDDCDGGDDGDGGGGVRTNDCDIPDIGPSKSQAYYLASCDQHGGDGCPSVIHGADCCISDIVDDEACSVKGPLPCDIDGDARAPTPEDIPVAPIATVVEPTSPASQPAPGNGSSDDCDGGNDGDGANGQIPEPTPTDESDTGDSSDSLDRGDSGRDMELERLRQQHKLDREGAIQAFSESASQASFLAAAELCTTAIASFEKLVEHIHNFGDENGNRGQAADGIERSKLSPLLWRRGAAHVKAGRHLSAVKDFETAITWGCKFKEKNYMRKGTALLRAGDLSEAKKMFQKGIKVNNTVQQNRECSQGISNANAVESHVEAGNVALCRWEGEEAICCANKALTLSPNYEKAQALLLKALEQGERWTEARRRCEAWAYKLNACQWMVGEDLELDGFEKGGGPPRVCVRALHASLQEGYCGALRNDGLKDEFDCALIEAGRTGAAWARAMERRRLDAKNMKKLADHAYNSNSFHDAFDVYSEAIRIDPQDYPSNAVLFANRAAVLMALGRDQEALQDCEEALRRKPDYPKVLERRARLIDRQVDQENTKNNSQRDEDRARAEREPEKTRQQHDQPQPQERAGAQRRTEQNQAEWHAGQEKSTWEAEAAAMHREYQERTNELLRKTVEHRERTQGADYAAEGREIPRRSPVEEAKNNWWEEEQRRVQQQLQDEMEREQKRREEEHRREQLKKQEEAMMRFKLAAERQREEAAIEAEKARRREQMRREDEEVRRLAAMRRAEREREAEEQRKQEEQAKKAAEEEAERKRAEQAIKDEEERKAQEAKKERERKRKERKDRKAEPRRRAAAAKKAEEERKAQEQEREEEMRQKAAEEEKEKRRIARWEREEEEARAEAARKAEEARIAEEKRKAEEAAKAEVRKREEKMRREAKKMREEKARWEEIQRRAAQKEKAKAERREKWRKEQERKAAERERERKREEWRKQQEQARREAEERERRRAEEEEERLRRERTLGRFFQTLGIPYDATLPEVKRAHRKLALMYHPDKNKQCKDAESIFREIQEAYEMIMDHYNGEDSS
eukprot:g1530.t2